MPGRVKQGSRGKHPVWSVDYWREQEVWKGQMKGNPLFSSDGVDDRRGTK